jgi:hypothetical protein
VVSIPNQEGARTVPILTVRTALLLLIAAVAGIVAGVLAIRASADKNIPAGILVGGGAAAGALGLFNGLLNP